MKEYEVIKSFNDKENGYKYVEEHSSYKCNDSRAEELIAKGFLGKEIKENRKEFENEYHIQED